LIMRVILIYNKNCIKNSIALYVYSMPCNILYQLRLALIVETYLLNDRTEMGHPPKYFY
jgi:hypothetical protein